MADRLIVQGALWSPALIAAFRATPRHQFLDRVYQYHRKSDRWREIITRDPGPDELRLVYSDRALITRLGVPGSGGAPVPISSSSQPSLMAQMLEDLRLQPGLSVLEIGAGTGYNAGLLAHVVGSGRVTTVDVDREVLSEAWDHLRRFKDREVQLLHADGREGSPAGAPYNRIMVTAATTDLEPAWLEQLAEGGLLSAPLALAPGLAYVVRGSVTAGVFRGRLTRAAYFMPLRAEDETGPADLESVAPSGELRPLGAPWAGWFNRRNPRTNWLGFSQALAFFGLVNGFAVHYRLQEDRRPAFGVSDGGVLCWYGTHEWQVNGEGARDLGWWLWRAFLDAGAPRPTEYDVSAAPNGTLPPAAAMTFPRQGPRCQQIWKLAPDRERTAS